MEGWREGGREGGREADGEEVGDGDLWCDGIERHFEQCFFRKNYSIAGKISLNLVWHTMSPVLP